MNNYVASSTRLIDLGSSTTKSSKIKNFTYTTWPWHDNSMSLKSKSFEEYMNNCVVLSTRLIDLGSSTTKSSKFKNLTYPTWPWHDNSMSLKSKSFEEYMNNCVALSTRLIDLDSSTTKSSKLTIKFSLLKVHRTRQLTNGKLLVRRPLTLPLIETTPLITFLIVKLVRQRRH